MSALTLVLNSSNNVDTTNKSTYRYNFIAGALAIPEGSEICVSSIVLPYSWFNINQQIYNNNTFAYTFPMAGNFTSIVSTTQITISSLTSGSIQIGATLFGGTIIGGTTILSQASGTPNGNGVYNINTSQTGATATTSVLQQSYTVVLPNGFYQINDINQYLQNLMISRGQYLISGGSNIYFLSIAVNVTYYANIIVSTVVPISLPSGYTNNTGGAVGLGMGFPNVASTPQFQVVASSPAFGTIIGFLTGLYPPTVQATSYSITSNTTPNATPVNSLVIRCSLVVNACGFPTDILDAMPITSAFGTNINYQPSYEKWVGINGGRYLTLTITFQDQNFNTIQFNDTNILITLLIKKGKSEKLIKALAI